jgi:Na+/H+ antiporter NhaD/arsenite permease-like protein
MQAYLCTSLDATGIFAYIAAVVTRTAGTGGHKVVRIHALLCTTMVTLCNQYHC